jgi:diguanylate cyclase (GGDEF)-like protein/PAS domain S-box-containing protein
MPSFQDPAIYRDILNGLQIGVSVLDLEKKIAFWSDGAEQITGYARIDVLGHSCIDNILLHCNQTTCEMCAERCPIAAALHDVTPVEAISFIHHKSGYRMQVHLWAIPLRDKYGSVIGIIQSFEGESSVHGSDPNDRSLKERGWLDEVTGLPNQAMMQSHLRETLGTFTELHIPFGVVCLEMRDLNPFRARYGQGAARSILEVLARTLRNAVWPTDFVGSWSEGRFLVILSGCDETALHAASQRILQVMASATIMWWGEELSVGVSLGRTAALTGDTVESVLERAQRGLSGNRNAPAEYSAAAGADGSSSGSTD